MAAATPATVRLTPEQVNTIARVLADPRRFAILKQIAGAESLPCSGLDVKSCIKAATISHHLKELQEAGLIDAEREGRSMRLSLRREVWAAYLEELRSL